MAELERPDGVRIRYEVRGEGPLFALASYWSWTPGVLDGLLTDLARDHRVLTYDLRAGTVWFPGPEELSRLTRRLYPEARVAVIEEGMISDPHAAAALIRSIL